MFDCFWLSVPVQVIAWKDCLRNDLLCVEWDVKPYTLTHCTSAIDCLERLVSEMTFYVSSGTLDPTHSLTHVQGGPKTGTVHTFVSNFAKY